MSTFRYCLMGLGDLNGFSGIVYDNTCSDLSQNFSHALHKICNKISIGIPGKQIKINQRCFDKTIFETFKLFTRFKLVNSKHTNIIFDICRP